MDMNVVVKLPEGVDNEPQQLLAVAQAYEITSPEMCEAAAEDLKAFKAKAKELEAKRKAITEPLDKAKKAVMDLFRQPLALLEQAESVLKRGILTYQQEEDRKRRLEEARRAELARQEKARLEQEAAEAAKQGHVEEAETLREFAEILPSAPIVESGAPKIAGLATRTNWHAEVVDMHAFVRAVAERPDLVHLLTPNMAALNALARAQKDALDIPGVKVVSEASLAARSA
ncbi:MAG: hypothetical protein KGL39_42965 [Patescibacteria group bacterium]|nr:hypothetical protein [Patescibacteria group bacterium]